MFLVLFLGEIGFPLAPSGHAVLLLAGHLATQGTLRLPLVIVVGVLAAALGASALYLGARARGRGVLSRVTRIVRLPEEKLEQAGRQFHRRHHFFLPASRFIPGMRPYGAALSGAFLVPYFRFLAITIGASILWVGGTSFAGQAIRGDNGMALPLLPALVGAAAVFMFLPAAWTFARVRAGR